MKHVLALTLMAGLLGASGFAQTPAPAVRKLDRTGLVSTFRDEFDGPFNATTWLHDQLKPDTLNERARPWAKEKQLYVDATFRGQSDKPLGIDPHRVDNGVLHLIADRIPADKRRQAFGYRFASGEITTRSSFNQQYGYFEFRAKQPEGEGFWTALWLLPSGGGWPPEIDIAEILGRDINRLHMTVHSKSKNGYSHSDLDVGDLSRDFHVYGLEWGPKELIYYFDDREVWRTPTPADLHQPCYLIANLALGGEWAGEPNARTPFPASLQIDWIRVWKRS